MSKLLAITILLSISFSFSSQAQRPQMRGEGDWFEMISIKFIPGMKQEAMDIANNYFVKADEKINREVVSFQPLMGEWDIIVYLHLRQGLEEFNYVISPADMEWMAALGEVAGSSEEADKIWKDYISKVESHDRQIVWRDK